MNDVGHYGRNTYNSKNALVRIAHQKRIERAKRIVSSQSFSRLLDFGCGDGLFLNVMKEQRPDATYLGFEPYMANRFGYAVTIAQRWDEVTDTVQSAGPFDVVTAFEVFEHFTPDHQARALSDIRGVMSDRARLIVSVPIESGPPSVVKNVIRRRKYGGKGVYSMKNIAKSLLHRPIDECRTGDYLPHMGFYLRDLEEVAGRQFKIASATYSPFEWLGRNFNSQAFYVMVPK